MGKSSLILSSSRTCDLSKTLNLDQNAASIYFNVELGQRHGRGRVEDLASPEVELGEMEGADDSLLEHEARCEVGLLMRADTADRVHLPPAVGRDGAHPGQVRRAAGAGGDRRQPSSPHQLAHPHP